MKRKKVVTSKKARGRGTDDFQEVGFEELDATTDDAVRFPELRMES